MPPTLGPAQDFFFPDFLLEKVTALEENTRAQWNHSGARPKLHPRARVSFDENLSLRAAPDDGP
jgi:hypothetical protein